MGVSQMACDPVWQLVSFVSPLVPLVSKHHHACAAQAQFLDSTSKMHAGQ